MKVIIEKGRTRLYFDPATNYLRLDYNGSGPGMELSKDEALKLSKALWYSSIS